MNIFERFRYSFCNYAEIEKEAIILREDIRKFKEIMLQKDNQIKSYSAAVEVKDEIIKSLEIIKAIEEQKNPIDKYCEEKDYLSIKNKAYKNKRSFQKFPIDTEINQFIQPNQLAVKIARKAIPIGQ